MVKGKAHTTAKSGRTEPEHARMAWQAPLLVGAAAAAVTGSITAFFYWKYALDLGGIAFFSAYLILWRGRIGRVTPEFMHDHAEEADEPPFVILAIAASALAIAVVTLFLAINSPGGDDMLAIGLGFFSVALGWLTVQTMMAMHYAYRFYRPLGAKGREMGSDRHRVTGGLSFPATEHPCGWDFLYHSLTIAISAEVSDVNVTSAAMRRMVIMHAVASFVFNTMVLAAAVNVVVSLGQ